MLACIDEYLKYNKEDNYFDEINKAQCLIHLKRFDEAQVLIDDLFKDKPDDCKELKDILKDNR